MKVLVEKIVEVVGRKESTGLDPNTLISKFSSDYDIDSIIEACQLSLERGRIFLNSEGMVQKIET